MEETKLVDNIEEKQKGKKIRKKFRKKELINAIKGSHGLLRNVAKAFHTDTSIVRQYLDDDVELQELFVQESNSIQELAEDLIVKSLLDKDISTAKWYLEHKSKDGYRADFQKVQVSFVDDIGDKK